MKILDFEKQEEKRRMLNIMKENSWEISVNENSSYEEVEQEYLEMVAEFETCENEMYPNGRDFDAENFDDIIE